MMRWTLAAALGGALCGLIVVPALAETTAPARHAHQAQAHDFEAKDIEERIHHHRGGDKCAQGRPRPAPGD